MDIVHLIETKIIKSTQDETSSHTYAEIERTIALDHSEGTKSLLYVYIVQTDCFPMHLVMYTAVTLPVLTACIVFNFRFLCPP